MIDVLTLKNFLSEASIMAARQQRIVSQIDAFMISSTRNIQYVLKTPVCLMIFAKDILDIYLNNIYHIVFSFDLVRLRL